MRTAILATVLAALLFVGVAAAKTNTHHTLPVRAYAEKAAASMGWTGAQWHDIDIIVSAESGWNPCAYNPSHSDCAYQGSASCGIPQAQPCPRRWLGRMWNTRYLQVWWLMHYIKSRYGSPANALAFREAHGWY